MACTHINIGLDSSAMMANISAALTAKYGAGVTIHYQDASYCIFSCPAISNRVIKIRYYHYYYDSDDFMDKLYVYKGTAWTSETTITDEVQFCGNTKTGSYTNNNTLWYSFDLVLGDDFALFTTLGGTVANLALIGKLSNGKYLVFGGGTSTSGDYDGYRKFRQYITDGVTTGAIYPIGMKCTYQVYSAGKFLLFPVYFMIDNELIVNEDGTPATIDGVYTTLHNTELTLSPGIFITSYGYRNENDLELLYFRLACLID